MTTRNIQIAFYSLLFLTALSCSTAKKSISNNQTLPIESIVRQNVDENENQQKIIVDLPETKETLNQVQLNFPTAASIEPQDKPDYYGQNFNDYGDIPIYDINNLPISVWFLKQGENFKGFIVAGHATKAVCEVASLEVYNKIKSIGKSETSIFSYGIGHNLLGKDETNDEYNTLMATMKTELEALESKNKGEVSVQVIDYENYIEHQLLFKKHIALAKETSDWDTHIVEYKLNNFPNIAPFFKIKSLQKIELKIPKTLFGNIPTELVFESYKKSLNEIENYLNERINLNKKTISQISSLKNSDDIIPIWDIEYFVVDGTEVYAESTKLYGYRLPPDDLVLAETDQTGRVLNQRPITYKEAITFLGNIEIMRNTSKEIKRKLFDYMTNARKDKKSFAQRKTDLIAKINSESDKIRKFSLLNENKKQSLLNRDNNDYIIDAFLRGWVFETGNELLNIELDKWYSEKRTLVWNHILDNVPNSRINENMAGIFHSDDVFFQIKSDENNFILTPYKVIGGEFIQVIDKKIGISYLQSPFNYRLTQN